MKLPHIKFPVCQPNFGTINVKNLRSSRCSTTDRAVYSMYNCLYCKGLNSKQPIKGRNSRYSEYSKMPDETVNFMIMVFCLYSRQNCGSIVHHLAVLCTVSTCSLFFIQLFSLKDDFTKTEHWHAFCINMLSKTAHQGIVDLQTEQ